MNRVELSGRLLELGALRYTPAGIPAVEFRLRHESEQGEAGSVRRVEAEIGGIAFEAQARLLAAAKLNTGLRLQGFLGAKSKRSKKLVLHVTDIEFIEGE
ncbi:MAG: primosomal replication protein N [Betaproteobacteria bacterium RIFCSPLOWO2_12_FULL_68_19]|nr:MAG: primosomal replication protein N [Betaproteobacteria bacterium RIFCSPLOWO2_12_FULL_68_19]